MSTTSSCQPHNHEAVEKCERAGTREFTAENTLGAKPYVFSGKVAVGGRRWRVSVSEGARLDSESGRQNVHETVARARFHTKIDSFQFLHFNTLILLSCQFILSISFSKLPPRHVPGTIW